MKMVLVHVAEEERDVIAEKSPCPGHEECAVLEAFMIGFEILRELGNILLNDPGFVKSLSGTNGRHGHLS